MTIAACVLPNSHDRSLRIIVNVFPCMLGLWIFCCGTACFFLPSFWRLSWVCFFVWIYFTTDTLRCQRFSKKFNDKYLSTFKQLFVYNFIVNDLHNFTTELAFSQSELIQSKLVGKSSLCPVARTDIPVVFTMYSPKKHSRKYSQWRVVLHHKDRRTPPKRGVELH